jgi:UDP-N-acetylglucosamine 2-epimerase (non-hydrolysing)
VSNAVCFVVGARPNFMKAAPVYRALEALETGLDPILVHTGQHYDAEMSAVFLDELGLPAPDVFLGVGSGTHAEQTARALVGVEQVLIERRPSLVVVPGDVNSTLAAALAAVKLEIPVAHLEAGLRSRDKQMPEEHNRIVADHLSEVLLAHQDEAIENLAQEGIAGEHVHLVGNTMIDSVLAHVETARGREPWNEHGVEPGGYALVTLHRPALVDDAVLLAETVDGLVALAETCPVIFPVHPRTRQQLASVGHESRLTDAGVVLSGPLGYLAFLGLEAEARFVLTDSGGVQEETSALGVRCFTLRNQTEREVTVRLGTNTVLGATPAEIASIPPRLETPKPGEPIPLWDGRAGERAAAVLHTFLDERDATRAEAVA